MDPRTLAQLNALTRDRLNDTGTVRPRYSDDLINRSLNEAQREACERAKLLCDEVSSITQLAILAGQPHVDLARAIFEVDAVHNVDTGEPLRAANEEQLYRQDRRWRTRTGHACEYVLVTLPDERIRLRFVPTPIAALNLQLRVYRLPRFEMEASDEPEIAARHHEHLVDWAIYRCCSDKDPDLYDPAKAADHLAAFTATFGEKPDANVRRMLREPRSHTVTSRW